MAGLRSKGKDLSTLDVVVVGGGPAGLMLACELGLSGVRPVVLERLSESSGLPKANGLVGQIVQMLDYRGLLERFSAGAPFVGPVPSFQFGALPLNLRQLGTSPLHVLPIPQARLERLLGERSRELGAEVKQGHELVTLPQDDGGVTLDVRGPEGDYRLRTRYLVGCDGAHSLVRKQAGIDFPGITYDEVSRISHVSLPESMIVPETGELELPGAGRLQPGHNRTARGAFSFMSFRPGVHVVAAIEKDPSADLGAPMTLEELQESVRRVLGSDLLMSDPQWLSRTVGNSRQSGKYRAGRVLLAGDAAHVFAAGGAALNAGLMDAVNLGWKLAAEIQGRAPSELLDTYDSERHGAGERTLMQTRAQTALMAPGEDVAALRELLNEMLKDEQNLRHIAELLAGTDIHYDMPGAASHPLVGRWVPDLPLITAHGEKTRVAELMREGKPMLLDLGGRADLIGVAEGWKDRVEMVSARCEGTTTPSDALLVRPDGYVAWAAPDNGDPDRDDLSCALGLWFGTAA